MKKMTLGTRLMVGGVIVVLIPLLIVGLFASLKASGALTETSEETAINVADRLGDMTEMALAGELKVLRELSLDSLVVDTAAKVRKTKTEETVSDTERLNRQLSKVIKQIGSDYEAIVVTNAEGVIFSDASDGKMKGTSVADRDYFKAAREGKANIGAVVKSKMTGNPVVPLGTPIIGESGEVIGTVGLIMKIDFLVNKIADTKLGKTGYAFMIDANGRVIAHPKKEFILEMDFKTVKGMEAIINNMLAHKQGIGSYQFEGIEKIAAYAPVELTGWSVAGTVAKEELLAPANAIRNGILLIGCVFVGLTVILVLVLARSISRPITRVVDGLNEAADQVAAASSQVSASSQSLAQGASQQAASLEETSSSLEEMASMTRQNADHANQANALMSEITHVVHESNTAMAQLDSSMRDISTASEETSKIIKTIDEIAFQTNLLALNAAVEAARAGEAGAGFAVVADEVRNLAIRAAEAAKNTANLIESTIKKIKEGTEQVTKAGEAFNLVASSTGKMGELVSEVAAASNEQAQGIDQVNKAVAEMDKVVQQNAANAEESAAASEELSAQSEHMKSYVEDLVVVVGRSRQQGPDGKRTAAAGKSNSRKEAGGDSPSREQKRSEALKSRGKRKAIAAPNGGQVRPEQVFPLNDEDLQAF